MIYQSRYLQEYIRLSVIFRAEGFEPPNNGIKTRCLTAWRRPTIYIVLIKT